MWQVLGITPRSGVATVLRRNAAKRSPGLRALAARSPPPLMLARGPDSPRAPNGGLTACAGGCRWHSLPQNARGHRQQAAAGLTGPPLHFASAGALSRARWHKPAAAPPLPARGLSLAAPRWGRPARPCIGPRPVGPALFLMRPFFRACARQRASRALARAWQGPFSASAWHIWLSSQGPQKFLLAKFFALHP